MNNARRQLIADAAVLLETALEEETEAFENLPESLQYSERGELMQQNIDSLQEALDFLEAVA